MNALFTGMTLKKATLYGISFLLVLVILGGGVAFIVFSSGGSNNTDTQQSANEQSESQSAQNQQNSERAEDRSSSEQLETTTDLTPVQILSGGIQTFRVVRDDVVYIQKTENAYTLRRRSLTGNQTVTIDKFQLDSPQYIYLPPQKNPGFLIVKSKDDIYRMLKVGSTNKTQLPERISYLTVAPVSKTIYAIMQPEEETSISQIVAFDINGNNKRSILSRKNLSRIKYAGNKLFYTTKKNLYAYDLSQQKERTILNDAQKEPSFNMKGEYYVGVVQGDKTSYLYRFANTPPQLQPLELKIDPNQIMWSNQERAFLHIQDQTLRTFTWNDDSVTRKSVNLQQLNIKYPYISTDSQDQPLFLNTSQSALYRMVSGRT